MTSYASTKRKRSKSRWQWSHRWRKRPHNM